MRLLLFAFMFFFIGGAQPPDPPDGIFFHFKKRKMLLLHPMRNGKTNYLPRGKFSDRKLDTLSNWFDAGKNHVEIIRQDHPMQPTIGMALVFEFDEENGEYPYTPAYAVLQLKDFGWGGVEFSPRDTMNYTGVSNAVSDDISIEILGFQNDTITGNFSGVLLSGAGTMASLDSGSFRVRLYRK
ncbi:MAG: hypothetical protein OHK0019_10460 [Saprospiraceae bacterium]